MPTTETRYVCRHIFTDGGRCQSPTLRGGSGPEHFCYYHHTTRRPIPTTELRSRKSHRACREPFHLPVPEDRLAIQHAISDVLQKIAANEIDTKRAGLLLYGLQTASSNLPRERGNQGPYGPIVEEAVLDPLHGLLAPEAEAKAEATPVKVKGAAQLMMEKLDREFPREPAKEAAADAEVAHIMSTIRASKSPLNPHPLKTLRKNRGRAYSRTTALTKLRGRSTSTPFFTAIK
jgi:hypothetical protein